MGPGPVQNLLVPSSLWFLSFLCSRTAEPGSGSQQQLPSPSDPRQRCCCRTCACPSGLGSVWTETTLSTPQQVQAPTTKVHKGSEENLEARSTCGSSSRRPLHIATITPPSSLLLHAALPETLVARRGRGLALESFTPDLRGSPWPTAALSFSPEWLASVLLLSTSCLLHISPSDAYLCPVECSRSRRRLLC